MFLNFTIDYMYKYSYMYVQAGQNTHDVLSAS